MEVRGKAVIIRGGHVCQGYGEDRGTFEATLDSGLVVLAAELKAGTAPGMSAQAVQSNAVCLLARDLRLSQRGLILF